MNNNLVLTPPHVFVHMYEVFPVLTYPYVVTGQDVVEPFIEIAISRETHIVKHWAATQNC